MNIQMKTEDKTNFVPMHDLAIHSSLEVDNQNIIVGIGEILWDVFPHGKVMGGAPANFAYHVSQFGLNGFAVSAIGDDELGNEIIENLNGNNLKYLIERTPFATGTVQVKLNTNGIPEYEILENVAWDNIPFSPEMEALALKTKTICFGSLAQRSTISQSTINRFISFMPADALRIFDINLRQHFYSRELIEKSLNLCNVLKINDDEVIIVGQLFELRAKSELEICQYLIDNFCIDMLILTKGVLGSFIITPSETSFKPTPLVEVADTVGAGDSFTAAFVAAVLKGKSISDAHQFAVDVSAFVCTQHGAMPILPDALKFKI